MKRAILGLLALCAMTAGGFEAASADAVGGPKYDQTRVPAFSTVSYTVRFEGGYRAEVALVGDGDTDLDLYVYDENGVLIASDTDYTDQCFASWVPRWTGPFVIKVVNRGSVYNNYTITTN